MPTIDRSLRCLLIVSMLALAACEDVTGPTDPPAYPQMALRLEQAYEAQSQPLLDEFFSEWGELVPPFTSSEVAALSDTVRQAYRVFEAFYSPSDLSRLTSGRHENFETDFRYVVMQNSVGVAVVDTNPKYRFHANVDVVSRQVTDFRPAPARVEHPAVYLSPQVDSLLYGFLYEEDGERPPDHAARAAFLRHAMQLTHHHWISDYHKATMPIASTIYLNRSLTQAVVDFRVFYQFGEAYLERDGDTWTLISSELTAIE